MTEKTTKTAETAVDEKGKSKTVATKLNIAQFEALDDYRWSVRMNMSQVLSAAVDHYIETVIGK